MRRIAVPVTVVLLAAPASAQAAPVSLDAACAQTRTLLSTTGGTNGAAVFAGRRFEVGAKVVDEGSGTYGLIADEGLRRKDRVNALNYLNIPRAKVWHHPDSYFANGWVSSFDDALDLATGLPRQCGVAAGGLLSQSGSTFTYANVSVEIVNGTVTRWGDTRFQFGPRTVRVPDGQQVAYAGWLKASQAASLNATMRTISRTVAASLDDPTGAQIEQALVAAIDPDRAVPLRVRSLRSGALIWARNPYTKTYHAWRVYLRDGEPIARRVAP